MSIEQQPPKHDQGSLPPYPRSDKDTVIPPPEHRDDKHEPRGLSRRKLIAGGLATLAVATGGIFGAKALGGGENTPAPRAPEASAPVDPTPATETPAAEATPTETAPATPEVNLTAPPTELSVEQYRDNLEALNGAFVAQYNSWMASGLGDLQEREELSIADDTAEAAKIKNAAIDKSYTDALYVQNWQQLPDLKKEVDKSIDNHGLLVQTAVLTTSGLYGIEEPEDIEPYSRHYELVEGSTEEIRRNSKLYTAFDTVLKDNSDKNLAEKFVANTFNKPNSPHLYHVVIGWEVEKGEVVDGIEMSGVYKIKSIYFEDRGEHQE